MKDIFKKLFGALDTHSKNVYSARKLSAFVVVVLIIILHVKWFKSDRWEYLGEVLALDFGFISLCLGMTTYESIKKQDDTTEPK